MFEDLELGLYLMREQGNVEGYFQLNPFLITVPMTSAEGDQWVYDIIASPKAGTMPNPIEPEHRDMSVRKVWIDEESDSRPTSITVTLNCDGEACDTVVLNGENKWSYTWPQLEMGHSYTVTEHVPDGYIVSYSYGEDEIVVTNTAKLPQTGQLNWPIPVLAGGGLLFLLIGFALISARKNNA